jgi:4-amino-4-deoxy-L-arabinose transferase-like glycosyltransferase
LLGANIDTKLTRTNILFLIFFAIAINSIGMFFPTLSSNDAYSYAVISKNMVQSGDFVGLYFGGEDWLDKPHFQFWLTALSYKIFGLNSFAYILPGFSFHILGAFYTFKLAKELYDEQTGLLSALLYLVTFRLTLSAIDIRAEAFLLGQIVPASYYFLLAHKYGKMKHIVNGAFFTALALMTKGLFLIAGVFGGVAALFVYSSNWRAFVSPKWLFAFALCFVFATPEFIALYLQFDAHPEKIVFGQQGVSGIKWFFWDSQFGRFFNSGPITNTAGTPWFYAHTFLWAFLPWSFLFFFAVVAQIKAMKTATQETKEALVFLAGSFFPLFVMFSATKFQLDHYTNIIFPFAIIFVANYISTKITPTASKTQFYIAVFILTLGCCLDAAIFEGEFLLLSSLVAFFVAGAIFLRRDFLTASVLSISFVLVSTSVANGVLYKKYNAGEHIAKMLNAKEHLPIYGIIAYSFSLELEYQGEHRRVQVSQLPVKGCYILIDKKDLAQLGGIKYDVLGEFTQINQVKFIPSLLSAKKFEENKENWLVLKV